MARRAAQTVDPHARTYAPGTGTTGTGAGRPGGGYGGGGYGGGPGGYGPSRRSAPQQPGRYRIIDYPRYGRRGWRRWVPSWKLVLGLFLLGIAALVTVILAAYAATSVPAKDNLATAQRSVVLWADGKTLGSYPGPARRVVPLDQVPKSLQYAVLSAEDRSFFSNSGVSLRGTIRAAVNDVRGGSLQGGSTITQQYVKNYFDLRDRTIQRKAKEFFIALKINRETDKRDILEQYLNTIYMGRNAYGVQVAAGYYFGKDVKDLTLSESAYLAGIINGPELYDLYDGPEAEARAKQRWNYVLDGMVSEGWITQAERDRQVFPTKGTKKGQLRPAPKKGNARAGQIGYLMDMVSKELKTRYGVSEKDLETQGLRIRTTFDRAKIEELQQQVADLKQLTPKQEAKGALRIGVATIDPKTGAVVAIYGGPDYLKQQLNDATQSVAQAGSTAKVFTLIAALQWGDKDGPLSLRSRFDGSSPQEIADYKFSNFGPGRGEQFGTIDLITATEHSVNTVYAELNDKIGPEKTAEAAYKAGIPRSIAFGTNPANVLGSASVHPIDLASAYATIAAGGVYRKPYVVAQVGLLNGGKPILAKVNTEGTPMFRKDVMADVTYAMTKVVRSGTATRVRDLDRPVAGKTGTASSNMAAWFVGFTPQYSTAVGMWRQNPKTNAFVPLSNILGRNEITGGSVPAQLWTDYMKAILDGVPEKGFPDPVFGGDTFNPAPKVTARPTPTPTDSGTPTPSGSPTDPSTAPGPPTPSGSGGPTASPSKTVPGIIPNPPVP